ncbi:class I SAM-dependent DNA methyltransferase [Clostridium hydrogeniformans]|uniref:class I SAM-dependent DNA methyltransferase n=1 Tax=Clostridium hydrogeniformans TaxID=349933 RepID=UPI0004820D68|nr:class I SAM-dependent methyltransferase [Clostridium hydrogeniformans]
MESYGELSSIYDELIYEDINYNEFYNCIMNLCREYKIGNENYLDLACGTGNLSRLLCKDFKNTYLVDLSEEMLMEATEKIRKEKINSTILCQNMCELNLNKSFDLITCSLDSTNYITEDNDLEDYFSSVHKHLKDNGLFIFDINSYYKLSEVLGNNIFTYNSEDVFYTWENIFEDHILEMNLTFFLREGFLYKRFEEQHLERAYTTEYIDTLLEDKGFKILKKLDNYGLETISDTTERITYVVSKG